MADSNSISPRNGFCSATKVFHSLRPNVILPPLSQPLSASEYALSLLPSAATDIDFLISAVSDLRLTYRHCLLQIHSLAASLKSRFSLSKGDVAFVLAPSSLHVPVIYLSLMSLGVVISAANPLSSASDLAHQVRLCNPVIAFTTAAAASKLPNLRHGVILVESPDFRSMLNSPPTTSGAAAEDAAVPVRIHQSDPAVILYSSGTTGRVKGVLLSHRNLIALLAGLYHNREIPDPNEPEIQPVSFFTLPLFHVFGFFMLLRAFAFGETLVLTERFDFVEMLKAVEKYRVTSMPVSPPLVVAFVKSELTHKYDLSSLRVLGCGGAPLGKEVEDRFKEKFPDVDILQGYGMTETTGGATRMIGPDEIGHHGSVGRLAENMQAKIVDPLTGDSLPPGVRGELWLRGPTIMKCYVGDEKATAETLDKDGWLRTGDLCYFDDDGFLYIVDRLKELIKYKAYQVAPAELEELLQSHPQIADAAVIPYPDEEAGQIPMAFVVRKPGGGGGGGHNNISEGEVIDYIAKQVAPYKKVRRVAFISSIPKNPAGKILRRELVSHATSVPSRL